MSLCTLIVTLFVIMDAFGNIPTFLKMVEGISPKRQRIIILREMAIALLVMVIFNYIGEFIFSFLCLSETAVTLSAGAILFLTALKIIFPTSDSPRSSVTPGEPFIVPLAIPLICGPSLLATIMLFARMEESQTIMLVAILIAWFMSMVILFFASFFKRVLGANGLTACERLLAMVLVMLAIQRFMEGIKLFVKTHYAA